MCALCVWAVAACDKEREITVPGRQWTARISGVATDSIGAPVPSATITIRRIFLGLSSADSSTLGRCVGRLAAPVTVQGATDGTFTFDWTGTVIPQFVCLIVEATATHNTRQLFGATAVNSVLLHG